MLGLLAATGAVLLFSDSGPATTAAPHTTTAPSGAPSPRPDSSPSSWSAPQPAPAPELVAVWFVQAWAGHQGSQQQWLQAMSQFASPALVQQMSSAGPDAVPAHRVTGKPVIADTGGGTLMIIVVPTDVGRLSVKLHQVHGESRWLVDDIEPGYQAGA